MLVINSEYEALRLVWHPSDFDKEGRLKGSAFSKSDLLPKLDSEGNPRYISMDLTHIIRKESVDWLIERGKRSNRIDAIFARFVCGELEAIEADEGGALFFLAHHPTAADNIEPGSPENPAHIGVCSTTAAPETEDECDLKVQELRTKLLECCRETSNYLIVFDASGNQNDSLIAE